MNTKTVVEGVVFDPIHKVKVPGRVIVENGVIIEIQQDESVTKPFILPGFIDSHIHIESSMLTPLAFSKVAKQHGTIAVVADPHEIANVGGIEGINFMINNSNTAEIKYFFGAPSCVPAGPFDDCNAILDSSEIERLLQRNDIYFLGEMMNFPGVINNDSDVLKKIDAAKRYKKVVDGHAPGLKDSDLTKYIGSGITTDHECFTLGEALEKISKGMKVLIREGSAAKNFDSLHSLIRTHTDNTMVCTDDCHPEDLMLGHINKLVKRALILGHDVFDVLQVVSVNPVKHYSLSIGLLQIGDSADFIVVDSIENLTVQANYIKGLDILRSEHNPENVSVDKPEYKFTNGFDFNQLKVVAKSNSIKAIQIIEGELVTDSTIFNFKTENQNVDADITQDFLKVVVVNRYKDNEVGVGFIKGFGLKKGAIAESIAHDSHHIVAVGVDDHSIYNAIDFILKRKGGLSYFDGNNLFGMALPIYGLISDEPAQVVAEKYRSINNRVIGDGCILKAPFMTLSFMALSVIPTLKITPKGLFDVNQFKFVDLFI